MQLSRIRRETINATYVTGMPVRITTIYRVWFGFLYVQIHQYMFEFHKLTIMGTSDSHGFKVSDGGSRLKSHWVLVSEKHKDWKL